MKSEQLYLTSDQALAAYLCLRGYTLLGAVDNGGERMEFALTHYELAKTPDQMKSDLLDLAAEYTSPFTFPGDAGQRKVSFKEYSIKLRMCNRALRFPVKMEQLT